MNRLDSNPAGRILEFEKPPLTKKGRSVLNESNRSEREICRTSPEIFFRTLAFLF